MLGQKLVALEVRSRDLLLELFHVLYQIAETLAFVGWCSKDDVVGHALPEQAFPLIYCDVCPCVLIGLPYLLKSLDGHS